jgi:hypothetical protein
LGLKNYPNNELKKSAETLLEAKIAAKAKEMDPEFQLQAQQMQMQAAQAAQQSQGQSQTPQNMRQDLNGATGNETQMPQGGPPAGMTREAMSGMDNNGMPAA